MVMENINKGNFNKKRQKSLDNFELIPRSEAKLVS